MLRFLISRSGIFLIFSILFTSCNSSIKTKRLSDYYDGNIIESKQLYNKQMVWKDTIIIQDLNSSFLGYFHIEDDNILFFDRVFGFVFYFDKEGKLINRYLGKGKGPSDFHSTDLFYYCYMPGDQRFIMDLFWNYFLYDKNWVIKKTGRLDFQEGKYSMYRMKNHPQPYMAELYEIDYSIPTVRAFDSTHVLLPVMAQNLNPRWNAYSSHNHYKYFYIFAKLDVLTSEISGFLGRKSPEYLKYRYLPNFNHFYYDVSGNNIFITFEPDSLITCITKEDRYLYRFGFAGRNMLTDYPETKTFEEADRTCQEHRNKYNYYSSLTVIPETGLIFRGYTHQGVNDGIQVYEGTNMILDVDVPKTFKVVGYINPYYYGTVDINDEEERLILYKFSIKKR